jgi:hypothetical protein
MRVLCPVVCLMLLAALTGCAGPTSSSLSVDHPAIPAQPRAPVSLSACTPDDRAPASRVATPSGEPLTAPILRLDTGMHTARIGQIGVDAAQGYLVTGSYDKTVRVWELASGRLLRTLRPPIGAGNEGNIYAVALSPDGSTVAAAGWTKAMGSPTPSISSTAPAAGCASVLLVCRT